MIRIVSRASSRLASKLDGQSMNTMVSPAISQMMFRRSYHASVVDHFEKPRNVGKLDVNDPNVGSGKFISSFPLLLRGIFYNSPEVPYSLFVIHNSNSITIPLSICDFHPFSPRRCTSLW